MLSSFPDDARELVRGNTIRLQIAAQAMRAGRLKASVSMDRPTKFPASLTPFFGRQIELHNIQTLLSDPACRLLTLVGPGGIGKTRLAIEAAQASQEIFGEGVCFADLQSLPTGELLPIAIMDALGITHGQDDAMSRLVSYLADRRMLLILDNFEHLLPWAELLTGLLLNAPGLKLLVTSREALNLQEEWQFPVGGIDVPAQGTGSEEQITSAVQMFAACARRARPDFSLENELEPVIEICRSVEGMPLAIELAASWTRMLPCAIIAKEIKENIRFLASGLRNIPERHRSMRAVFQQTWRMLSPDEQQVYKRLSVFRGGFTQAAARKVAAHPAGQASLTVMLGLVDKSLLRRVSTAEPGTLRDRFGLHELLRQFAQDLLAENEEELRQACDQHCDYYLSFLEERFPSLLGGRQKAAVQEIHAELENVRAAWNWAVENRYVDRLVYVVQPLDAFFQFQSRYLEGATVYEQAAAALANCTDSENGLYTLAQLLNCQGWFNIRVGNFDQARKALEESTRIYLSITTSPPPVLGSDPRGGLSLLAVLRGAFSEAIALAENLLQVTQERGDLHAISTAHYALASAYLAQGQYETAQQHAQQVYDSADGYNDEWVLSYSLKLLGDCAYGLRDTQQARMYYLKCYQIRESFQDPEGMALALAHLGKVAQQEKNYLEAERFFEQSRAIYATIYDRGGLATALNGLGDTALDLGDQREARLYLAQALQVANDIHFVPLILSVFVSIARLFFQEERRERALHLLRYARTCPSSSQETRRLAGEYLAQFQAGEAMPVIKSSAPANQAALQALAEEVLREIESLPEQRIEAPSSRLLPAAQTAALLPRDNLLIEALTDREIEILRCISRGLSNQEIAEQLVLSLGTVKWYTSQIYGKLQVNSRTQATAKARSIGIL